MARSERMVRTPDLCAPGNLLLLLLVGSGMAIMLALAGAIASGEFWPRLGFNGLFIFWVVLCFAGLWCRWPGKRPPLQTGPGQVLAFLLIQLLVLVFSLAVLAGERLVAPAGINVPTGPVFFVLRNQGISAVAALIFLRYVALQQHWKAQVEAETSARLESLQARIRPHFLFNALNTISSLINDRPDQAEQATMDLSDLLRTGLKESSRHSLGEELDLVRGYLRIESLRLGDRLAVDWTLDDDLPLELQLPALLIQPLVENGVVHGIARLSGGGTLQIRGERYRRKRLRFEIENPVPADEPDSADGNRMALDNIRQRLELAYEEGARLRTWREDGRFHVELIVPA